MKILEMQHSEDLEIVTSETDIDLTRTPSRYWWPLTPSVRASIRVWRGMLSGLSARSMFKDTQFAEAFEHSSLIVG